MNATKAVTRSFTMARSLLVACVLSGCGAVIAEGSTDTGVLPADAVTVTVDAQPTAVDSAATDDVPAEAAVLDATATDAVAAGGDATGVRDVTDASANPDAVVGAGDARADADASADATALVCPSGQTGTRPNCAPVPGVCATGNGGCDQLTTCTNVPGGRTCGACPSGYTGTGATMCTWNDPSLTALVPSAGTLSSAFASATTGYSVTVGLALSEFGLRPAVSMPAASTITVDGAQVASGQRSVARALALGDTVFRVVVTAAGGATRTYTVTVHRAPGVFQQAYVKASNTGAGDIFGYGVALSGDTLAVGASGEDSNATGVGGDQSNDGAINSGAVYVFTRTGTTWTQQAYLKASNAGAGDIFGSAVALSGDTLAVGASGEDSLATGIDGDQRDNSVSGSGAVYVFKRSGTTWRQRAYVKPGNTADGDSFGAAVALSGDTLAVGALNEDSSATGIDGDQGSNAASDSGALYVFTLDD